MPLVEYEGEAMGCTCEEMAGAAAGFSAVCFGQLWMFASLSPPERQVLAGHATRRWTEKGRFIFLQGEPSTEMFLLKSGRVKLTKILEDGNEITLDIRKAGDFIGENLLSATGGYPVNALCMDDTFTCGFSRDRFEQVVLQHPNIGKYGQTHHQLEVWREAQRLGREIADRLG